MKTIFQTLSSLSDLSVTRDYLLNYNPYKMDSKKDREELCIHFYLFAHFCQNSLNIPVVIWKDESPDFIAEYPETGTMTGIEHVRATSEVYKMSENKLINNNDFYLIEPSHYRFGVQPTKENSAKGLKRKTDALSGPATYGDQGEVEWVKFFASIQPNPHLFHSNSEAKTL